MQSFIQNENDFRNMQLYANVGEENRQGADASVAQQQPHYYNHYQPQFNNADHRPAYYPSASGDVLPANFSCYQQPHFNTTTPATSGTGNMIAVEQLAYAQPQGGVPGDSLAYGGGHFVNDFGNLPAVDHSFNDVDAWARWNDLALAQRMQAEMQAREQRRLQMQAQMLMQAQLALQSRAQASFQAQQAFQDIPNFAPNHLVPDAPYTSPGRPLAVAPDAFDVKPHVNDAGLAEIFGDYANEPTAADYNDNKELYQETPPETTRNDAFPVNDFASFPVNYASAKVAQDAALNCTSNPDQEMQRWVPTGTQRPRYMEQAGSPAQDDSSQPIQQLDCQAEAVGPSQVTDQPTVIASASALTSRETPYTLPAIVVHRAYPLKTKPRAVESEILVLNVKEGRGALVRYNNPDVTPVVLYTHAVTPPPGVDYSHE